MTIPVKNVAVPVLDGEVAERFIEQCEYNAKHLAGSEYRGEFEDIYKDVIARSPFLQKHQKHFYWFQSFQDDRLALMVTACKHVYAIHHQYQPSHFMLWNQ